MTTVVLLKSWLQENQLFKWSRWLMMIVYRWPVFINTRCRFRQRLARPQNLLPWYWWTLCAVARSCRTCSCYRFLDSRNTLGKTHDRCYYIIKCGPMVLSPLLSCGRWQGVAGLIRFRNACRDGITERWTSGGLMVMWGCHVVSFQCLKQKLWLNTMTRLDYKDDIILIMHDNATPICSNMWSCLLLLLVVGCGCGSVCGCCCWLMDGWMDGKMVGCGFLMVAHCGSMSDMQWIDQATPLFQQCVVSGMTWW